jgi:probable F420-dependent oxidoreductase
VASGPGAPGDRPLSAPRFGILASGLKPQGMPPASEFRRLGERAEELGYDSLWVADRIASGVPGSPLLEGVAALGAFAGFTRRIRLGTCVLVAPARQPTLLAKQLATLDLLSEGRLTVGLGLGENPHDYAATGAPFHRRGRLAEELLPAIRAVWAGGAVEGCWFEPGPHRPGGPPIWVGAQVEAAVARAGRLADGWIGFQVTPEQYAERLACARQAAAAAGRDAARFAGALMIPVLAGPDGGRAREEARDSFSRRFRREVPMRAIELLCAVGTPAECVEKLGAYVRAGASELILSPMAWSLHPVGDAERVHAEVVEPAREALASEATA